MGARVTENRTADPRLSVQWLLQHESLRLGEISSGLAAVAVKIINSSDRGIASTRTSFSKERVRNPSVWCSNPSYEASK